ncbi:MAG: segregation/condensation protein A [Lachnospiraceae bacterium]|nr:segregation/condensation protein A [Lachnospiraceae bacterium]
MMEAGLDVKLPVFSGPLELLLHLIDKNKVSIYDIPIAEITDQYMEYLDSIDYEDLDNISEFLVMASTLLSIKAKMLLPEERSEEEDEEDEDPREELVRQLVEYKTYHELALRLAEQAGSAGLVLYKEPTIPDEVKEYEPETDPEELLSGVTLEKLNQVFNDVLKRQKNRVDPIRSRFGSIKKEKVSLDQKIGEVISFARVHRKFSFRNILKASETKTEVIVTFLAMLELMKTGKIKARQEEIFGDIEMESQIA